MYYFIQSLIDGHLGWEARGFLNLENLTDISVFVKEIFLWLHNLVWLILNQWLPRRPGSLLFNKYKSNPEFVTIRHWLHFKNKQTNKYFLILKQTRNKIPLQKIYHFMALTCWTQSFFLRKSNFAGGEWLMWLPQSVICPFEEFFIIVTIVHGQSSIPF